MGNLRSLPSVDKLLQIESVQGHLRSYGRPLTLAAIRDVLQQVRDTYRDSQAIPTQEQIVELVEQKLKNWTQPTLRPVINATGVVLHTNLGRAPLSQQAREAVQEATYRYTNLEFELSKGKRGSRLYHAERILCQLTGAEAALVVNNNAAAVLLILAALANRRYVVIARSQLVEIGGGFRIPDVMKQSGAKLLEIGTTNRVHLSDYEESLVHKPALFLIAHRSNFQIVGFTSEPHLSDISVLAHQNGIIVFNDLGSGTLLETEKYGLSHEPTIQESLKAGADIVCFSGDKLLGGPQAGIIVGKAALVEKARRHPLARALRCDKMILAALSATLIHYLKDEAEAQIPIWWMISTQPENLFETAHRWSAWLANHGIASQVIEGRSTIGGGSLPGETLPTFLLALRPSHPEKFLHALNLYPSPIVARLEDDQVVFDPRTVFPEEEKILLEAIRSLARQTSLT
ncbi:MAG: L-seryl-tRNA(Sec) selenium transferase [Chloroflexota bacterium]